MIWTCPWYWQNYCAAWDNYRCLPNGEVTSSKAKYWCNMHIFRHILYCIHSTIIVTGIIYSFSDRAIVRLIYWDKVLIVIGVTATSRVKMITTNTMNTNKLAIHMSPLRYLVWCYLLWEIRLYWRDTRCMSVINLNYNIIDRVLPCTWLVIKLHNGNDIIIIRIEN